MRAVVQRVFAARVEVSGEVVGQIGPGLLAFVGVATGDTERDAIKMADKVTGLRIFEDENGKMSRSLLDVGGGLLVVSQFTLYGDTSRGKRPSFDRAMPPSHAEVLYERFVAAAKERIPVVQAGRFRAMMRVVADNDGPVTLLLDTLTPL
jgi:D-tyrosyl-tRNA(Tyr) deacylase